VTTIARHAAYSGETTPVEPVFLRAGPSNDAPVISTLQPGMPLRVMASANGGWMRVESPDGPVGPTATI
jgi:hypothetical protein